MRYFGYTRLFGALVLLGMLVGRRLRDAARVVEQATDNLGDDICRHGVCPHECPSCRPLPPRVVGRAVVASDDLEWQASLARMQQELDALLAYGEER